jgi:NDP-sugar pyrophosphorylase family protein
MALIAGKPLIDHQIEWAIANEVTQVFILAGRKAKVISNHFAYKRTDIDIQVIMDHRLMGTGGTILHAVLDGRLPGQFVMLYGDLMICAPLKPFLAFHERMCADVSCFIHPTDHPLDSDLVELNKGFWISRIYRSAHAVTGLSNAGLYIVNRSALNPYRRLKFPLDFGKELLPQMLNDEVRLAGYIGHGYIKDIGTPERYDQVCKEFAPQTL